MTQTYTVQVLRMRFLGDERLFRRVILADGANNARPEIQVSQALLSHADGLDLSGVRVDRGLDRYLAGQDLPGGAANDLAAQAFATVFCQGGLNGQLAPAEAS